MQFGAEADLMAARAANHRMTHAVQARPAPDARRDLGKLKAGVPGRVHDDGAAFTRPGVRTRFYAINREQAEQAMDVARAAGVDDFVGAKVKSPRKWYRKI